MAVRSDLEPGLQMAQGIHAGIAFTLKWPSMTADWFADSNYLIAVAVPDEAALHELARAAAVEGAAFTLFCEPDLEDQATAIAIEPGVEGRRLCGSLPLAGRKENLVPST